MFAIDQQRRSKQQATRHARMTSVRDSPVRRAVKNASSPNTTAHPTHPLPKVHEANYENDHYDTIYRSLLSSNQHVLLRPQTPDRTTRPYGNGETDTLSDHRNRRENRAQLRSASKATHLGKKRHREFHVLSNFPQLSLPIPLRWYPLKPPSSRHIDDTNMLTRPRFHPTHCTTPRYHRRYCSIPSPRRVPRRALADSHKMYSRVARHPDTSNTPYRTVRNPQVYR